MQWRAEHFDNAVCRHDAIEWLFGMQRRTNLCTSNSKQRLLDVRRRSSTADDVSDSVKRRLRQLRR